MGNGNFGVDDSMDETVVRCSRSRVEVSQPQCVGWVIVLARGGRRRSLKTSDACCALPVLSLRSVLALRWHVNN